MNNQSMKKKLGETPATSKILTLQSKLQKEAVLRKMYFYGNVDKTSIFADLDYSLPKLSSKVWLESYRIFENETQLILNYLANKSKENNFGLKISNSYDANLDLLIDLKELHNNQLLILRILHVEDVESFVHRFKLRMGLDEIITYLQCRNFVYLTFMILLQYSESVDEEFIYLLLVLLYSIIYVQRENLTYFNSLFELVDYSVYEISFLLNNTHRMQFENLISNSIKLFSIETADGIVVELMRLLVAKESSEKPLIDKINIILTNQSLKRKSSTSININLRQELQQMMNAMDSNKIKKEVISVEKASSLELLDTIISSHSSHDRFSSLYEISNSSKNLINIIAYQKEQCAKNQFNAEMQLRDENYHIHELSIDDKLEHCIISLNITIVQYFDIMSETSILGWGVHLKNSSWWNTYSKFLPKSGPTGDHIAFSPKMGLKDASLKQNLIINSTHIDFTNSLSLKPKKLQKSRGTIETWQVGKSIDGKILKDYEIITILENLLHQDVLSTYEVDIFGDIAIIFIYLDFGQQEKIAKRELETDSVEMLKLLMRNTNIHIILLID